MHQPAEIGLVEDNGGKDKRYADFGVVTGRVATKSNRGTNVKNSPGKGSPRNSGYIKAGVR